MNESVRNIRKETIAKLINHGLSNKEIEENLSNSKEDLIDIIRDLLSQQRPDAASISAKKWILTGEIDTEVATRNGILSECGRLLDMACSSEILGEVLFEGEDGKYYTITTEAVISEANPEYAIDALKEADTPCLKCNSFNTNYLEIKDNKMIHECYDCGNSFVSHENIPSSKE